MHVKDILEPTMVVRLTRSELGDDLDELYEATRHGWVLSDDARDLLSAVVVTHDGVIVGAFSIGRWEQPLYLERRWSFVGDGHDRLAESLGEELEGAARGRRSYIVPGYDFGSAAQRLKWFRTYGPNPPQDVIESLRSEEPRRSENHLGALSYVTDVLSDPYVAAGVTYVVTNVLREFRERIAKPYSEKEVVDVLELCWTYLRDKHKRPIDALKLRSVDQSSHEAIVVAAETDRDIQYTLKVSGRGWNRRVRECKVKTMFDASVSGLR